jgi:hypothetical protein
MPNGVAPVADVPDEMVDTTATNRRTGETVTFKAKRNASPEEKRSALREYLKSKSDPSDQSPVLGPQKPPSVTQPTEKPAAVPATGLQAPSEMPKQEVEDQPDDQPMFGQVGKNLKEFAKSIPTGAAKTVAEFARSDQIEADSLAYAMGLGNAGPKIPTGAELSKMFNLHEPQGFWGHSGEAFGEMAINPATYFGPGSAVAKFIQTATAVFGGEALKEVGQAIAGRFGGTAGNIIGLIAGAKAPQMLLRSFSPIMIDEAHAAANELLASEGITSTAGQKTGSEALETAESFFGNAPGAGGKATEATKDSGQQFTEALFRRTGMKPNWRRPQWGVKYAFRKIRGDLDNIASKININFAKPVKGSNQSVGTRLINEMAAAFSDYKKYAPSGAFRPGAGSLVDDVFKAAVRGSVMPGMEVQKFRSNLLKLARRAGSGKEPDHEFSQYLDDCVDAFDRAIEASVPNSKVLGAWKMARLRYKNLLPVALASTGAGKQAAAGVITPPRMRQVLNSSTKKRLDYAQGKGPYALLVEAANLILHPLPNSHTAQREMAFRVLQGMTHAVAYGVGIGGGGAAGMAMGGPTLGVGLAGAGAAAASAVSPGLAGKAIMSRPMQSWLGGGLGGETGFQAGARAAQKDIPKGAASIMRNVVPALPQMIEDYEEGGDEEDSEE